MQPKTLQQLGHGGGLQLLSSPVGEDGHPHAPHARGPGRGSTPDLRRLDRPMHASRGPARRRHAAL